MSPSSGGGISGGILQAVASEFAKRLPQESKDSGGITPVVQPVSRPSQRRKSPTILSSMIPDFASGGGTGKTLLGQ